MTTPTELEEAYRDFTENFKKWAPDGIIDVGLEFLYDMGLLNQAELEDSSSDDVTHYFHVIETPDKITLHNEKFAIWIVPKVIDELPTTHTYISMINKKKLSLELVFSTAGVYNTPKYILKVLQHLLIEVIDTEDVISSIGKKPS